MRRTIVVVLVTAACVLAPLAITAWWLDNTIFDTSNYVATVKPLSKNTQIDDAVAGRVTDALLQNVDLSKLRTALPKDTQFLGLAFGAAVRNYIQELVSKFLQTDAFQGLWVIANTQAQKTLVAVLENKPPPALVASDGSVHIDLTNVVARARQAVGLAGLDVAGGATPVKADRTLEIVQPNSLDRLRDAATTLRKLSVALPVAVLVLGGLGLALSRERRRTIFWLGGGLAAASLLALVAVAFGRRYYLEDVVGSDVPAAAAKALYDTLLRDLRFYLEVAVVAGAAAMGGAALAGETRTATRIRARTLGTAGAAADRAAGQSATMTWVADNKGTLRTITFICALVYLATAGESLTLTRFALVVVLVLLALGALEVLSRPRAGGVP
jgi:hypothetical protein